MVIFFFSASLSFSSFASLLLSVDGIVSFFKKQAGPASVELKDEEHLQKFISDADASVVGELPFEFSVSDFCIYGQCHFSVMGIEKEKNSGCLIWIFLNTKIKIEIQGIFLPS